MDQETGKRSFSSEGRGTGRGDIQPGSCLLDMSKSRRRKKEERGFRWKIWV